MTKLDWHQFPHIYESVHAGDEFGEYLQMLEEMYHYYATPDELADVCLKVALDHIHSGEGSLDELIDHWHNYKNDSAPLHIYLGMTWEQYGKFMKNNDYRPWNEPDYNNEDFIKEWEASFSA